MLHQALKEIRIFHGLKQIELSKELNISASYISEIEKNIKQPTILTIEKYSKFFSISPSSILLFSENLNEPKLSDKFRKISTKKILKIMQWLNNTNHE